jgi:ADP-heptose:LPS heptosyltransferase
MRFVDRRIGIPLCYLLSGVYRIKTFFTSPAKPIAIKRILFMQISEMGSAISAYSAIKKAQQLYPHAELYYFIFSEMQESVHLLDLIPKDRVFTVTSKSFVGFALGLLRMILKIRRYNFDVILDLELFSRLSSLLSYLFKSKIRVGFHRFHMEGLYRGTFHTHKVIYNHLRHISYNFLSLVYAISSEIGKEPCTKVCIPDSDLQIKKIRSSAAEKKELMRRLRVKYPGLSEKHKIIILNPNASELLPLRRWPLESYSELAKKILQDPSAVIVITGVQSEIKDAEAICSEVKNERCINFAGETTLRQLIDLYNIGRVLLSNDSGPPNFASLTDIHGLVFFGPETPVCYKPLGKNIEPLYANYICSPCVSAYNHRKSACTKNECLRAIRVDEVHKRIKQLLRH